MSLITLSQLEASCIKGQGYADDIGEAAATAINAVLETASQAYSLAESAGKTATDYLNYDDDTGLIIGCGTENVSFYVDDNSIHLDWKSSPILQAGIGTTIEDENIVTVTLLSFSADDDSGDYSRYALTNGSSYGLASYTTSESTAESYTYYVSYGSMYYYASSLPYSSMEALCTALYSATYEDSNELASADIDIASTATRPYYSIGVRSDYSIGRYSTTIGHELESAAAFQVVIGKYNTPLDSDYIFVVGAGTSASNRKNVLTVTTSGTVAATTFEGDLEGTADYASALKVSAAVGGAAKPVYINSSGVPTACSSTVGSSSAPVYLKSGTITKCSSVKADALSTTSVGDKSTPVYIDSSGVPQECNIYAYIRGVMDGSIVIYYVYYSGYYYYDDSFPYSSLEAVASYHGGSYVSATTLATNTMTVNYESVTVSLILLTVEEEGEENSEFTVYVLSNGTGYSANPDLSTTSPEEV